MTKEEKYELARWAVMYALRNGATQAGVIISNSKSSSVEVREKRIEKLEQSIESSLSIRLFVRNRYSSHSTNRLKKDDLERFIREAIEGTSYLSEDQFRSLPPENLYYKGGGTDLKIFDKHHELIEPDEKIHLAFSTESEAAGMDERIISVTAGYSDGMEEWVLVNSNGFEGDSAHSSFSLFASVSVKGGDARPEAYWYDHVLHFKDLKREGTGKIALERALNKIGQRKIRSGRMTMIVENRQTGRLFGPLISALYGSSIQQKSSFLADKLGEKVFSGKLNVVDDPSIISGFGSRWFDGEGLASGKRIIFEEGTVASCFLDTYYAKKLGMQPTSGTTSNLVMIPGENDLNELTRKVKRGILVSGFNGGNCNGTTGDFSYGIEGFYIENGEIVHPVSEMNITGNMKSLWSGIAEMGNDAYRNSSWRIPSVMFDDVDFSGI